MTELTSGKCRMQKTCATLSAPIETGAQAPQTRPLGTRRERHYSDRLQVAQAVGKARPQGSRIVRIFRIDFGEDTSLMKNTHVSIYNPFHSCADWNAGHQTSVKTLCLQYVCHLTSCQAVSIRDASVCPGKAATDTYSSKSRYD